MLHQRLRPSPLLPPRSIWTAFVGAPARPNDRCLGFHLLYCHAVRASLAPDSLARLLREKLPTLDLAALEPPQAGLFWQLFANVFRMVRDPAKP